MLYSMYDFLTFGCLAFTSLALVVGETMDVDECVIAVFIGTGPLKFDDGE